MIVRIVKMTFRPDAINAFQEIFDSKKQFIRHFDGCQHLELWQEEGKPHVFFTYSHWDSEHHLDKYRFSSLFKEVWASTKILFAEKAEAWSVGRKVTVQ